MPKKKTDSMEEMLRKLGAKLDDLMGHAQVMRDYAKKVNLNEVMRQKAEVEKKLKDLEGPAREAMKEVRSGIEGAWREIRGAAGRAKAKFKK